MSLIINDVHEQIKGDLVVEDVEPGELVSLVEGGVRRLRAGQDDRVDGLATFPNAGDAIAEDEDDAAGSFLYRASDNDRVPHGLRQNGSEGRVLTVANSGSQNPVPEISYGDIVGVPATGKHEHYGRIVQNGYTDANNQEFTVSKGNLIPVGIAREHGTTQGYDELIRVSRRLDL